MGLWVVGAKGEGLEMTAGGIGLSLLDPSLTIPKLVNHSGPLKLDPVGGTGQRMGQALQVNLPGAFKEIGVVLTIVRIGCSPFTLMLNSLSKNSSVMLPKAATSPAPFSR